MQFHFKKGRVRVSVVNKLYTLCMVLNNDQVLLLDRQHDDFKGFIPPGGKVEFPESFTDSAIREVKEETGLVVSNLVFKGVSEFLDLNKQERTIIFNYFTTDFEGELLAQHTEGKPVWVPLREIENLPMQPSVRSRFPLFFEEGTFEIHVERDHLDKKHSTTLMKT